MLCPVPPAPQRHGLESGTVACAGKQPTIRCHGSGDIVSFAYRVVKRRAFEARHHFQVGDIVRFRRSPQPGNAANGLATPKAEQVWVLSLIRAAPSAVVGNAAPLQAVDHAPEALPAAARPAVADRSWRHGPYSIDSSAVAVAVEQ
eukprot:TRINITY_DN9764_c0_g2_i1.p2 TRINITY_DN9764_c0_g2~~TRINITY_DN9764_c0_g2_i1.p2  ORF type:complete len:146 (+),score=17.53 TRINITY_DN9764_c0_g2_i1:134-571(+)